VVLPAGRSFYSMQLQITTTFHDEIIYLGPIKSYQRESIVVGKNVFEVYVFDIDEDIAIPTPETVSLI
jgi:hypothetical protein